MATLEKIRSKAGLLIGIVGFALFAFVFGDLQSCQTFFQQSQNNVATVNGESIGYEDFHSKLEISTNNFKNSLGGASLSEAQLDQVRQMVFDEMVSSILLNKTCKNLGIVVGGDEEKDIILGDNISPTIQQISIFQNPQTRTFDRVGYLQFVQMMESDDLSMYPLETQMQLENQKESWKNLKKNVVEQKLLTKFSTLLMSAIVSNSLDAKAAFNDNSVNVDFDVVSQPYNMIPDTDIEVTDSEIAKLYELRKSSFKQDKAKVINYIAVNIIPSEEDFSEVSSQIESLRVDLENSTNPADIVNENSDVNFIDAYISEPHLTPEVRSFAATASIGDIDGPILLNRTFHMNKLLSVKQAPDSVKINQIMFPGNDESIYKSTFDSLINVIKSGKLFSEVSLDETQGQSDGDMGWHTESSLVRGIDENFANALFNAKVNEIFTVKSSYGIHLVQVVEKTNPVKKYKIASVIMEVTPSQDTYNKLYNNLNQFISRNNTLEKFKVSATEAGYFCQTDVQISENQNNISNIENSRQVIRWVNNSKKGAVSDVFECQNYFIAAAVEGELKAGFRPLAEVSDILKRELINEKKGAKIVESLKSKNLNTLEDYAEAMNSNVQDVKFVTFATSRITGLGVDPVVNAKALASEIGKITGPFAGNFAVYVLSLTNKTANEHEYNDELQKQQMNMQNSYRIMQLIQDNNLLKEKASIEDNRSRFY